MKTPEVVNSRQLPGIVDPVRFPSLVQLCRNSSFPNSPIFDPGISLALQRNSFLSKATSPVSCLTPPPEVTTIHAIEPAEVAPIVGVQDASNQTDAPESEDQEQSLIEASVKQEQSLSPCQLQNSANLTTTTTNLTNLTNFEIVAASPEKVCNVVRITTTTTTVNPAVCSIVGKVDKAENTVINMADCPKYSITKECRSVTSIDRTIEHVVTRQIDREHVDRNHMEEEGEQQFAEDRISGRDVRTGPRIIEITEENCDSFHENLEFFGRRRDHSLDRLRDEKKNYPQETASAEQEKEADTKVADEKCEVRIKEFIVSCFSTLGENVNFFFFGDREVSRCNTLFFFMRSNIFDYNDNTRLI